MTRLALAAIVVAIAGHAAARELVHKVSPQYPIRALDRGEEGWVEISFQIAADGVVISPKVVAAEPKGRFDKSAVAAVAQWRYEASGADEARTVVVTFSQLAAGSARQVVMEKLSAAAQAVREGREADADETLEDIVDTGGLTLAELSVLEKVRGMRDYRARRFVGAAVHFNRVLEIFGSRMDAKAVGDVLDVLIPAYINAGMFAEAVQTTDRWQRPDESFPPPLASALASIRSALAAGRPIRLAPAAANQ